MKSSIGHIANHKTTNEQGLILGEISFHGLGWQAQFSYDDKIEIGVIKLSELDIGELKSDNETLLRLLRDINSTSQQTRELASEILCDFIEEVGADIELDILQTAINKIVDRIAIEDNWNVGQKLGESIYEFICLQKIDKTTEFALIKKLALLDKDILHSYLDDEEYLQIKEVNDYITDKTKWWNTGS